MLRAVPSIEWALCSIVIILRVCALHQCYESTDLKHSAASPSFDAVFHFMKMPVYLMTPLLLIILLVSTFTVTNKAAMKSPVEVFLGVRAERMLRNGIVWTQGISICMFS